MWPAHISAERKSKLWASSSTVWSWRRRALEHFRHIATIRCGKGNRTAAAGKCENAQNRRPVSHVQCPVQNPSGMAIHSAL